MVITDNLIESYETILNLGLKKKYSWFSHINLTGLWGDRSGLTFKVFGTVFVDDVWGYNQFREYYYSMPIPDDLKLGDIIGGELSHDLRESFKNMLSHVTSSIVGHVMIGTLEVRFVDDIILESKIKRTLHERKQSGILFHNTSVDNLIKILQDNKLKTSKNDLNTLIDFRIKRDDDLLITPFGPIIKDRSKYPPFISLTRDKGYKRSPENPTIVIDGEKLSDNYKIVPYSQFGGRTYDEREERVYKDIRNLDKYIIKVILPVTNEKLELLLNDKNIPYEIISRDNLKESIRRLLREDNNELGGRITVWLSTQYDKVFDNLDLYVEVDQENIIYGKWYDKEKDVIFSRNHFGVFWIHDCESYRLLRSYSKLFSINTDEFDQSLVMYLNNRYIDEFFGKPIQDIGDEFNCLDDDMNLQENIRRILREETSHEEIKDIILNGDDFDDWIKAIRIQYGDTVPLYHSTTEENSKIIDKEGFKLTYGKNYKSFSKELILYFQIGESDYVSKNRPVLYRLDVPVDFLYNAEIDMDGPNISDEELFKYVDEETWDDLPYEIKDAITYFIWNDFSLDGTEIFITGRFLDNDSDDIFKDLKPIKVKDISTK